MAKSTIMMPFFLTMPISRMMPTKAALFAGIPLVIATGPGTELRRPLGITIIGGLFVSQILTLYTTPVIYLLIDRLRRRSEPRPLPAPAE